MTNKNSYWDETYYWNKGWRHLFYIIGWFGVISLWFWLVLAIVHQVFAFDKPFFNEYTDYAIYIGGLITGSLFIIGWSVALLISPFL